MRISKPIMEISKICHSSAKSTFSIHADFTFPDAFLKDERIINLLTPKLPTLRSISPKKARVILRFKFKVVAPLSISLFSHRPTDVDRLCLSLVSLHSRMNLERNPKPLKKEGPEFCLFSRRHFEF